MSAVGLPGLLAPPGDQDDTMSPLRFVPPNLLPHDDRFPLLGTVAPLPDPTGEAPRQGPLGHKEPDPTMGRHPHAVGVAAAGTPYEHGVTVTGGAGGIAACTEELAALAAALASAARGVQTADVDRRRLAERLGPVGAAALSPLGVAGGLPALERRLAGLSTSVRDAAAVYAAAEEQSSGGMHRLATAAGTVLGDLGPRVWLVGLGAAALGVVELAVVRAQRNLPTPVGWLARRLSQPDVTSRDDVLGFAGRLFAGPGVLPRIPSPDRKTGEVLAAGVSAFVWAAFLPGPQPPLLDTVPLTARLVSDGVGLLATDTCLRVRPVGLSVDPRPRTEADLLGAVQAATPAHSHVTGEVAVQRLERADGTTAWVVAIPGTQNWAWPDERSFDLWSDLQAVGGRPDDATGTVVEAMRLAGIEQGEPVLLVGHSQGGIAAATVASAPSLRREFDVVGVLTAGSPVSRIELPSGIAAMHLEHAQDIVPGLAGLPNPDTVDRVTVVRDLQADAPPGQVVDNADAHELANYRQTAAMLPAGDPSVQGFRAAMSTVLDGDVVQTVTWRFQGTRVPLDAELSASCVPPG